MQQLAALNPFLATSLGLPAGQDELPDLSPAGADAEAELQRATLTRLAEAEKSAGSGSNDDERRCGRLLRERLETELAISATGENLRAMSNIFGPAQQVRSVFLMMPAATADDWAVIARRLRRVPEAMAGYRASLTEGSRRGLHAAPRQVETVTTQLDAWLATGDGRGWFADFTAARAGGDPGGARGRAGDGQRRRRRGCRRAARLACGRVPARDGRHARWRRRGALPPRRETLERGRPGSRRGLRLGLVAVPPDRGRDED